MFTNDIKKGMAVQMRNGFTGIMMDNMKGNTRMVEITNGFMGREMGSVYSHDIVACWIYNQIQYIEYTPKQMDCQKMVHRMFGG